MKKDIIDINESTIKKFVESLRPEDPEIREKLDFGYSYDGKIIEIFEIRPEWDKPKEIQHIPFVKIRYYKSKNSWNLYWMRGNLKWESYEPFPNSSHLNKILEIIQEDKYGCFYG
ncbi:DUF3024 domain-containing protein [Gillisia hiemivivida]|jgi:hypothetical protein|uniref:DUF3024 domain-containing protein n=1 Tax=Gillisia hiemivivida TaxID=291190 RepID=A0A5C6ZNH1_9FLAO|nr:DUF3024 domain-containing protein [Gillisia hiemivivida]TXD92098.1 DUF3024 domain-containing protein [Gillisia hiemivivida]